RSPTPPLARHAALPILEDVDGLARGRDSGVLNLRLFFEQTRRHQIVFNLLKSRQHALPIAGHGFIVGSLGAFLFRRASAAIEQGDRKSTRLNSSHVKIS